jgi:hypothetical protein
MALFTFPSPSQSPRFCKLGLIHEAPDELDEGQQLRDPEQDGEDD